MGGRFLCLTHVGRKSGRQYRTVLEVTGTDRAPGEVFAIAGLGPAADWYRNIELVPAAEVIVGRRRFVPAQRVVGEGESVAVLAAYERRNRLALPVIRRVLSNLLGWRYDGSDAARLRLARQLPVVAFRPVEGISG
nr:nitroreductase family deazaflavin-dependent oxidoreductase [Amycolatopsis sp. NBRC 101858]